MLDIRNQTPFSADLAPMLDKHGREAAVIAIKGTFAVRGKSRTLRPAEKQEPIVTGDVKIDAGKNMILTAKEAFTMEAGKDMSLHADGGGSITVDKAMVQEAVKDFTVKAKKIGVTAETDYIVAAKKMDFKADNDFKVEASKVTIKASGDMVLKGSKIAQN